MFACFPFWQVSENLLRYDLRAFPLTNQKNLSFLFFSYWSKLYKSHDRTSIASCHVCITSALGILTIDLQIQWNFIDWWKYYNICRWQTILAKILIGKIIPHYNPKGCGFDLRRGHCDFSLTYYLQAHCCLGVNSGSNRNECQVHTLAAKGGRCVRITTWSPSCSDNLKFCEPQTHAILRPYPGFYKNCFALRKLPCVKD